jgi:hypothetical protein
VENFLKLQITNQFKKFKEFYKDVGVNLSRKLDQNILKLLTDPNNKQGKELIECNFDSELFGYMIELDNF